MMPVLSRPPRAGSTPNATTKIDALATDPDVIQRSGGSFFTGALAREYGFTEDDGSLPPLTESEAFQLENLQRFHEDAKRYSDYRWALMLKALEKRQKGKIAVFFIDDNFAINPRRTNAEEVAELFRRAIG